MCGKSVTFLTNLNVQEVYADCKRTYCFFQYGISDFTFTELVFQIPEISCIGSGCKYRLKFYLTLESL